MNIRRRMPMYLQSIARETLHITIWEDAELSMYFHGEGEEFYLHYDYWPYVHPVHHVSRHEKMVDFLVGKEVLMNSDEGSINENYSYLDNLVSRVHMLIIFIFVVYLHI